MREQGRRKPLDTGPPGAADKALVLDGFTVLVNTTVANGRDEVGRFDVQGDGQFLIGFQCRLTLQAEDTSTVKRPRA